MRVVQLLFVCKCFTAIIAIGPALVTASPTCTELAAWAGDGAKVVSAELLSAPPAHCQVRGVIDTTIRFELLLPEKWNGKFLMGGAGAFVGHLRNQAQAGLSAGPTPLARGYATVATDTGHSAPRLSASWAMGDAAARENYAHRAVHRTAEVAKAIVAYHYSRPHRRSYFLGCSNG